MENGAVALRSDIDMGKLYVSENKNTILKSLKEKSANVPKATKTCKAMGVTEVSEPAEMVSLGNCKSSSRQGGYSRSQSRGIVKTEEVDARAGLSAVFPNLVEKVIGGDRGVTSDSLLHPALAPVTGTVAHERDNFFKQASAAGYPLIMYVMCFLLMYIFFFFRF